MIKQLRKRHFQIWIVLLVLLPASIVMARLVTPKIPIDQLLQPSAYPAYPTIIKTITKDNYSVHLRKANDSSFQLEWINKKILIVPSAAVYKLPAGSNDTKNGVLIGRIEGRGVYRFAVDTSFRPDRFSSYRLFLYDFIHQQVIDTIKF